MPFFEFLILQKANYNQKATKNREKCHLYVRILKRLRNWHFICHNNCVSRLFGLTLYESRIFKPTNYYYKFIFLKSYSIRVYYIDFILSTILFLEKNYSSVKNFTLQRIFF